MCVDSITEGPADTVLRARLAIKNDKPLVIANSDQFINGDLSQFYEETRNEHLGGVVLTMEDNDPKWSYARVNSFGHIIEVREKEVISNQATVGIYGYSKAEIAWECFERMWKANDRTNDEFYVAPSYNYMKGKNSKVLSLGSINEIMHGIGIPEDYEMFCDSQISKDFVQNNF